jgi:phospholipid N-methyltransferase
MRLPTFLTTLLQKLIKATGYELSRIGSKGLGYISLDDVLEKAESKNITVNQYLEEIWNLPTHADAIINGFELKKLMQQNSINVLEIGAGTGVYTDKLISVLGSENISTYQVYETSADWANYLRITYPVDVKQADGYQLNSTETNSIDLVHVHGVFVYTSFVTTISYIKEMIRVVRKGGIIAFDVLDHTSYSDAIISRWISEGQTFLNIIPEEHISSLLLTNGFIQIKLFQSSSSPGSSRYYVYRKEI